MQLVTWTLPVTMKKARGARQNRSLIFLKQLTKNGFCYPVCRGFLFCRPWAWNRRIFWWLLESHSRWARIHQIDFYISQILLVDIILAIFLLILNPCYCKAIGKQNFLENCLNFDFPKKGTAQIIRRVLCSFQ